MYNLKIKSSIHDYELQFITEFRSSLETVLQEGDVIIIDNTIAMLYSGELTHVLSVNKHILIDANEPQKSYQGIIPVIDELIQKGFRKNHRLIAIGGGVTQDVTAFIASIIYRGVDWYFFPTTLLAQCDSCIGSKTSINFGEYNNQVGGFIRQAEFLFTHSLLTL